MNEEQKKAGAEPVELQFPTMLRKMWSGTEVQDWLDKQGPLYTRTTAVSFQQRVQPWMLACFGAEIAANAQERNHRFLEEALELVQACGATASEAHQLVGYVYGRSVGDKHQEVGGVMVTLAALCLAQGLDMHAAGEVELARIWTKVEQIRAKQVAKPKHSPLPQDVAEQPSESKHDTGAARDFEQLVGVKCTVMDLFTRVMYKDFLGERHWTDACRCAFHDDNAKRLKPPNRMFVLWIHKASHDGVAILAFVDFHSIEHWRELDFPPCAALSLVRLGAGRHAIKGLTRLAGRRSRLRHPLAWIRNSVFVCGCLNYAAHEEQDFLVDCPIRAHTGSRLVGRAWWVEGKGNLGGNAVAFPQSAVQFVQVLLLGQRCAVIHGSFPQFQRILA